MPDLAAAITKKVETVGALGAELAAIRKAMLGKGPVQPGNIGPPQTDNEAGDKPHEGGAQPDAEEDIGHPNAPEVLTGKELTPAQKSARDLAFALGLHPEQKSLASGARKAVSMRREKKSADELAALHYAEKGRIPIGKLLQTLGTLAGSAGGTVTTADYIKRRRERKNSSTKLGQISAIISGKSAEQLATEFYLERGEKAGIPAKAAVGLGKRIAAIFKDEAIRTPMSTVGGVAGVAGTGAILLEQRRQANRQNRLANLFGIKSADFMPRNEREQTQEMPNPEGEPEAPMDPSEMQSLRGELDLTPLEAQLFDQLVSEGGGVEDVQAGQEPQQVMAPTAEEPMSEARRDNLPSNGMEGYGQAPKKPLEPAPGQPGTEAVPGQGPSDMEPGSDLEGQDVPRPEGATYQSEATGSETSEAAAPGMSTEMTQMIPGASHNTVQTPPMSSDEAQSEGQSEDEAFQSLVAKLERAQEMQGKSLDYDEKNIGMLLARAARKVGSVAGHALRKTARYTARGGAAASRFGAQHAQRPGAAGFGARVIQRGGAFAAKNPRTTLALGTGTGLVANGIRDNQQEKQRRRQYYGY